MSHVCQFLPWCKEISNSHGASRGRSREGRHMVGFLARQGSPAGPPGHLPPNVMIRLRPAFPHEYPVEAQPPRVTVLFLLGVSCSLHPASALWELFPTGAQASGEAALLIHPSDSRAFGQRGGESVPLPVQPQPHLQAIFSHLFTQKGPWETDVHSCHL